MARNLILTDRWGYEVDRASLTRDVGAPSLSGARSPLTSYPGDGLNPLRLAQILRAADHGDPVRYMELAEVIEERDPHYLGVIGTRKRSVSQLDITVEAASDDAHDGKLADMVRDWVKRDELQQELFHILDCLSKGYSATAIIWDHSEGQYLPKELAWRDPRIIRFARHDLARPLMLDDSGREVPLPAFRFVFADIPAKSGILLRAGLARVAMWGWMFKAFTGRDWAIFTQTYGQPLRVGKWQPGASEQDKATLFRAVANIAGDCAALIPDTMSIDFIESKSIGQSGDLYEKRVNHLDQQISKAVLGQTATTDAIAGGHAVGREHRLVQEDIEGADASALSAIINRDVIRPWIQLEFGPQKRYPRIRIGRPKTEDLSALATAVDKMVRLGMEIEEGEIRARFGFSEPKPGARLLRVAAPVSTADLAGSAPLGEGEDRASKSKRVSGEIKRGQGLPGTETALQARGPSAAISGGLGAAGDPAADLADQLARAAPPVIDGMIGQIELMMNAAGSLGEFRQMLLAGFPGLDAQAMAELMAEAFLTADLAGRLDADGRGDG